MLALTTSAPWLRRRVTDRFDGAVECNYLVARPAVNAKCAAPLGRPPLPLQKNGNLRMRRTWRQHCYAPELTGRNAPRFAFRVA
jgi:hypothetical protein